MSNFSLYKATGKGYARGWWRNCNCRYRIFKGARNTKKSVDILGYEIIDKIISDERRNVLIIRNTFASHRDSTWVKLIKIINNPVFDEPSITLKRYFKINKNEMRITYIPTGQVILFKGMDDAQKLQGIDVITGYLTDVYVEEAYELKSYDEWYKVDGSIRGKLPEGLFFQITFCLNPWDTNHWINEKFFKGRFTDDVEYLETHNYQDFRDDEYIGDFGKGLYLHTGTYKMNEFRDKEVYDLSMENMKANAYDLYKTIALGCWGNTLDATYPEFNDSLIISIQDVLNRRYAAFTIGIDFGVGNGEGKLSKNAAERYKSATTMQLVGLTDDYTTGICIDEYFYSNEGQEVRKGSPEIQEEMISKIEEWMEFFSGHPDLLKGQILCYVDCADSGGFRDGLALIAHKRGLFNITFLPSTKISIQSRVDFDRLRMANKEFLVCDRCKNLIREIKNCKRGEKGEVRGDVDDHAINANEYAWAPMSPRFKRWREFKIH